jgi:FtsP/CotA-like multicopper oxidase with cupredoxin domain
MNNSMHTQTRGKLVLRAVAAAVLALGASQAMAVTTVTLCAQPFSKNLPVQGGTTIAVPMWGYSLGSCGAPTAPGPVITIPAGETTLQVTLINNLAVPTSLVIASQKLAADGGAPVMAEDLIGPACTLAPANSLTCRLRSFTGETAPGATRTYTFTGLRPGSFLYQSGTHPQVQIQMGLAGMARISDTAAPSFEQDVPVVLSEVDVAMHTSISSTLGTAGSQGLWQSEGRTTLKYAPNYFLVNGAPFDGITAGVGATDLSVNFPAVNATHPVRLRIANAGLESRSLVLNSGTWKVMGENGYAYPMPREQASLLMPAGTTADADLGVQVNGGGVAVQRLAFFDRRAGVRNADSALAGGMLARIVNTDGPALDPIANQIVNEGTTYNQQAQGHNVTSYGLGAGPAGLTVSTTGAIAWPVAIGATGGAVQVTATNGTTTVSQGFALVVNHAPVAAADGSLTVPARNITLARNTAGTAVVNLSLTQGLLNVPAITLTANDTDPDGPLTSPLVSFVSATLVNSSGTPVALPAAQLEATFTYDAVNQQIVFRPRTALNGNGVPANALGLYAVQYRIVDAYGLASNAATAYISVQ